MIGNRGCIFHAHKPSRGSVKIFSNFLEDICRNFRNSTSFISVISSSVNTDIICNIVSGNTEFFPSFFHSRSDGHKETPPEIIKRIL
nr:MAG TPA: hypothetical protein [Caudoviricetes sp.]